MSQSSSVSFDTAYGTSPPWDIGVAQPALVELFRLLPPTGPILELGCGTGALAMHLTKMGLNVLAVDLSETTLAQARRNATALPAGPRSRLEFQVGNALRPTTLSRGFNSVVDSGFFHLFGPAERGQLAQELATVLPPGGRYYLLGVSFDSAMPNPAKAVREAELRMLFSPGYGWEIAYCKTAEFVLRSTRGNASATLACIQRKGSKDKKAK